MLQPKRRKYRKEQKDRNTGIATRGNAVSFGEFGLKSIGRGRLPDSPPTITQSIPSKRKSGIGPISGSTDKNFV